MDTRERVVTGVPREFRMPRVAERTHFALISSGIPLACLLRPARGRRFASAMTIEFGEASPKEILLYQHVRSYAANILSLVMSSALTGRLPGAVGAPATASGVRRGAPVATWIATKHEGFRERRRGHHCRW